MCIRDRPTVEEMLYKSVFYAVGTRCGFNMSSEEQDMNFIINISGEDNIYRFGSLVCDVSCSVLKEFNYRVRHIENERRVTNGRNETDVPQESRWNVVSQPKTAGNSERRFDAGGKIRDDGSRISEREREKQVQHTLSSVSYTHLDVYKRQVIKVVIPRELMERQ